MSNGLIKEVASAESEIEKLEWLKSGFAISLTSAALLGLISFTLYYVGTLILLDAQLSWVFLLIGAAQLFTGLGNTSLAFLSAINAISAVALSGIIGALFSALFIFCGTYYFGFSGAVAGCAVLALSPSLFAIRYLHQVRPQIYTQILVTKLRSNQMTRLLNYSFAMVVTAAAVPLALILMRHELSQSIGWEAVGHWQAVSRIGDAYIQVFGTLFASILLPKLSALSGRQNLSVMFEFVPPIMAMFLGGAFVFWLFSNQILTLAYSSSFATASNYVVPQLIADFFKIFASFFIYRFVALGRPKMQAYGEVIQAGVMVLAFWLLRDNFGGLAAVWAYASGATAVFAFAAIATAVDGSHRSVA